MAAYSNKSNAGWYLENMMTGAKIKIPEGQLAHHILDNFHQDEKKNWCLKPGTFESNEKADALETTIVMPDGSEQSFLDDTQPIDRRAFVRKNMQLKVVLISGNRIFRTVTKNISLGGIMLEAAPPRDYGHPDLKVLIENRSGNLRILIKAEFITYSKQTRAKFIELTEDQRHDLGNIIDEEIEITAKIAV